MEIIHTEQLPQSKPSKCDLHIQLARQQASKTKRVVVVTVIVAPDAPEQYFTGRISGKIDNMS